MIKRLQRKFILMAMAAFLAVLAVIITGINIVNYHSVVREADTLLDILIENRGTFPLDPGIRPDRFPGHMSPEVPYETRYFSVTVDAGTGVFLQADTSRITSVDAALAVSMAQQVLDADTRGFLDAYRYAVTQEGSTLRVTFLDWGRKLDAFHNFLLASIGISLLGYLAVFILIAFFSGRIIRPISESYEKQRQFITDAGHEIKTPLTIISANVDLMEMEYGHSECLDDIRKQTERLVSLTGSLVLLSRMEEAESKLECIEFPVSDIVSEAAAPFHAPAQTQGKTLLCHVQPMLSFTGNGKAIAQLVGILLDNALKYSPAGSSIGLTLEKQNKQLILTVSNSVTAPIPQEKLDRLFERFYRAEPSHNSQTGGSGIGLSVAKAIVTAHRGKIRAAMAEPDCFRITVTLPVS